MAIDDWRSVELRSPCGCRGKVAYSRTQPHTIFCPPQHVVTWVEHTTFSVIDDQRPPSGYLVTLAQVRHGKANGT